MLPAILVVPLVDVAARTRVRSIAVPQATLQVPLVDVAVWPGQCSNTGRVWQPPARLVVSVGAVYGAAQLFKNFLDANGDGVYNAPHVVLSTKLWARSGHTRGGGGGAGSRGDLSSLALEECPHSHRHIRMHK